MWTIERLKCSDPSRRFAPVSYLFHLGPPGRASQVKARPARLHNQTGGGFTAGTPYVAQYAYTNRQAKDSEVAQKLWTDMLRDNICRRLTHSSDYRPSQCVTHGKGG